MQNRIKATMKSLVALGLDLESGKSGEINMCALEVATNTRHVSNGSRIIRDDVAPFSFFKIERKYCGSSLQAVQFHGYRDVEFEFYETSNKIESVKDKIKSLKKKLKQLEQEQEFLLNCDSGNKIYGKVDVEHYLQSEE